MIRPGDSLLKYERPVLLTKKGRPLKVSSQQPLGSTPVPPPKLHSASAEAAKQENKEILDIIFPPREWTEGDKVWVQRVSSAPCTREDVLHLEELLDKKLQQRQASELGICPTRRELYSQCFDELVRQVTISCAERGSLLSRVRDESQRTITAYHTAYGMRKALQAEMLKSDMEKRILELQNEKQKLKKELDEEEVKCNDAEQRKKERRDKMDHLKRANQQLMAQLEGDNCTKE